MKCLSPRTVHSAGAPNIARLSDERLVCTFIADADDAAPMCVDPVAGSVKPRSAGMDGNRSGISRRVKEQGKRKDDEAIWQREPHGLFRRIGHKLRVAFCPPPTLGRAPSRLAHRSSPFTQIGFHPTARPLLWFSRLAIRFHRMFAAILTFAIHHFLRAGD